MKYWEFRFGFWNFSGSTHFVDLKIEVWSKIEIVCLICSIFLIFAISFFKENVREFTFSKDYFFWITLLHTVRDIPSHRWQSKSAEKYSWQFFNGWLGDWYFFLDFYFNGKHINLSNKWMIGHFLAKLCHFRGSVPPLMCFFWTITLDQIGFFHKQQREHKMEHLLAFNSADFRIREFVTNLTKWSSWCCVIEG